MLRRILLACVALCGCNGGGIVNITVPSSNVSPTTIVPFDMSVGVVAVPGVSVSPRVGLTTTTSGGVATISVVLDAQPSGNVHVDVVSSDVNQGSVSPAKLTFNFADWNVPQTLTVTGVDDFAKGNHAYTVTLTPGGDDPDYSALKPIVVSLTNIDTDRPGFVVTPTSGLSVTPGGPNATATFTVHLTTPPAANVTTAVSIAPADAHLGTVAPSSLVFTPANWLTKQTVTVTGVDDNIANGNQIFDVLLAAATSTDTDYNGIDPPDVAVTNVDVDVAGVTVSPTSGLVTQKNNGTPAHFTVVLHSEPVSNVTIGVSSSDTTKGTVSPSSLVFTSANWNVAQTVTVNGVNDNKVTGNTTYNVNIAAPTGDPVYAKLSGSTEMVTSIDTDTPNIILSRTSGLQTVECGNSGPSFPYLCQPNISPSGTDTVNVTLSTQPTANVTIAIASDNTSKGTVSGTTASTVVLTPTNWNTGVTVTVTGVENSIVDSSPAIVYHITFGTITTSDTNYKSVPDPSPVSVTSIDDDFYVYGGGTTASTDGNMVWCSNASNCTNNLTVNAPYRGGTANFVVWISGAPHGVESTDVPAKFSSSGLLGTTGSPYFVPLNSAGSYKFDCTVHTSGMIGTLVVQ